MDINLLVENAFIDHISDNKKQYGFGAAGLVAGKLVHSLHKQHIDNRKNTFGSTSKNKTQKTKSGPHWLDYLSRAS